MSNATDTSPTSAIDDAGAMPALPDPRPLLASAAAVATEVIHGVTTEQVALRTPCHDFSVADLVDHLVMVAERTGYLGRGDDAFFDGAADPHGLSVDEMKALWTTKIAEAQAAWLPDESLARTITAPWATMPGAAMLLMYVSEITAHTWDLAKATGQHPQWDPAVVGASLALMKFGLPADQRDQAPFAAVVTVDDDAQLIDRLVGWTGRDPAWA